MTKLDPINKLIDLPSLELTYVHLKRVMKTSNDYIIEMAGRRFSIVFNSQILLYCGIYVTEKVKGGES